MNFAVVPLFPTPLYVAELGREITDEERAFIMAQRDNCMQNNSNVSTNICSKSLCLLFDNRRGCFRDGHNLIHC